jgi:AAA family ATP:ADP antiporter
MTAFLERFTNLRRVELPVALASSAFFFFVLTALMVLRPAREALGMQSGLDAVRWLFVGTAVVTLAVNPVFGFLVSRFTRLRFIAVTYLFFGASLVGFWALLTLAPAAVGELSGRVFYVWFSVFNLFATMVFWALMADRFSLAQSKRLFGMIAIGGTLGAIAGPALATVLIEPLGTANLLLVATTCLLAAVGCAWIVARLQPDHPTPAMAADPDAPPAVDDRAVIGGSPFEGLRAAVRSPYMLGMSGYVLILAVVATFLYFTRLAMVAELGEDVDGSAAWFARIDLFTQVATLVAQLLLTGHLMKRLGVPLTLALLPLTVALGMIGLAIVGTLAALVLFEATFRAVQRAIMRPARETLFTVVSREDKYKAKGFIDTFVYRGGDVAGAWTEGLLGRVGMGLVGLSALTVPMAIAWAVLGVWLGRAQERRARGDGLAELPEEPAVATV